MPLEQAELEAIAAALNNASPAGIGAVAIKLPPFWTVDPAVWFAQVESQFQVRQPPITADDRKYNYVVAALDNSTAAEVRPLLLNPPATDKP